jgi:NADH-quinone oxidoreductase subunit E
MLSEDERREIEEELPRYASRRAVCIDAMRVVQRHRGWLSDEALQDIAEFLGMTTHELEGVATFYNLLFRRPVGRHVILLCDSVSCWIMGYERVQEQLTARLGIEPGATTADGRFTLLPIVCLGACDRAPVMMVDDELHGDLLAPGRLDAILEGYA